MNDFALDIERLKSEAAELPYGPAKRLLLEEAIRLADLSNDVQTGYALRMQLMTVSSFTGRHDVMLVAFAWCCAKFDRHPDQFDTANLLWRYKWVASSVADFPEISLAQMDDLLNDMERRYREFGSTLRAVWQNRRGVAIYTGRPEMAEQAHREYLRTERDSLSDCAACEPSSLVGYLSQLQRWSEAVDVVEDMLRRGLKCTHQPHHVLSKSLLPLFHLGRLDEARRNQKRGYRLVRSGSDFVCAWSRHIEFLALAGELDQARRLVDRHLAEGLSCVEPGNRFMFLRATLLFAERLLREGIWTVKLRLPAAIDVPGTRKGRDVAALAAWVRRAACELADRFDARNGNVSFNQRVEQIAALLDDGLPVERET